MATAMPTTASTTSTTSHSTNSPGSQAECQHPHEREAATRGAQCLWHVAGLDRRSLAPLVAFCCAAKHEHQSAQAITGERPRTRYSRVRPSCRAGLGAISTSHVSDRAQSAAWRRLPRFTLVDASPLPAEL